MVSVSPNERAASHKVARETTVGKHTSCGKAHLGIIFVIIMNIFIDIIFIILSTSMSPSITNCPNKNFQFLCERDLVIIFMVILILTIAFKRN